jgi:pSer/pThr/pTyr-binding forkhead associated (FHA) protein
MAKLVFLNEKFTGRAYEFKVPTTTVGRGEHNTLTIQDTTVSQTHCEILVWGEEVIVRDLNSTNGTYVNGERLQNQQRPVSPGQIVRFGAVEARLEMETTSSSDTDTDVTAVHAFVRHLHDHPIDPALAKATTREISPMGVPGDGTLVLARSFHSKSGSRSASRVPSRWSARELSARILLIGVVFTVFMVVVWLAARQH